MLGRVLIHNNFRGMKRMKLGWLMLLVSTEMGRLHMRRMKKRMYILLNLHQNHNNATSFHNFGTHTTLLAFNKVEMYFVSYVGPRRR